MQTKKQSAIESIVNVLVGLITSFILQLILYPLLDIPVTLTKNIILTTVFFIVSFTRGYFVRLYFNKITQSEYKKYLALLTEMACEKNEVKKRELLKQVVLLGDKHNF